MTKSTSTTWTSACIFLGLLLLGLGSRLQHNIGSLCSRILAWAILFQYPFYFTSGSNVRNLIMYGMQPEGLGETFVYGTWTYQRFFELTKSSVKAYQLLFFKLVTFLVSSTLHCIYLGEKYQFPGYVLIYPAVLISHMALTSTAVSKLWQPIDAEFARKSGPPTKGAAMVGFFVITVGFGFAKRHLGLWAGAILPLVLSAYENIGCRIAGQFFLKEFVEKGLHNKFGMTQEILPSLTITYLHLHVARCAPLHLGCQGSMGARRSLVDVYFGIWVGVQCEFEDFVDLQVHPASVRSLLEDG